MPLLPRRFERLKTVLNQRMADLTVLLEHVEKPHNLSAILRSCDAVGALEAHAVSLQGRPRTFNSTAQGSQKWVALQDHPDISTAIRQLKERGFRLYGTHLGVDARDYRDCDFTGPTAFVLGAEKWGLSDAARDGMDEALFIPMRGMVQSLNVSVATATLLFEALRQRQAARPPRLPRAPPNRSSATLTSTPPPPGRLHCLRAPRAAQRSPRPARQMRSAPRRARPASRRPRRERCTRAFG